MNTGSTPCDATEQIDNPAEDAPRSLPSVLVLLLAVCCAVSVANVYYAQPLLDAIAEDFRITQAAVGGVITATQVGCALALLLVVPLGDLLNRKVLMCIQLVFLTAALAMVGFAHSPAILLIGMVGVGMLGTAMTQGLIAYAATLAHQSERGRVVGAAQSGVVVGLLMARCFAGVITDLAGWRSVYLISGLLAAVMLLVLWNAVPTARMSPLKLTYAQLLRSMFMLLASERVLRVRGVIGLLMFAAFSIFWSALVLPLSAPPHSLSHTQIGAFGLVGAIGALAAARAGYLADRGLGQWTTGIALICLVTSWMPISLMPQSMIALMVGIALLDLGGQAVHVVNQSMILSGQTASHGRLVGCYMLFYSAGSGIGAAASTYVYAQAGWMGVCVLGFAVSVAALVFWAVTLRSQNR
ncbi:MFS transporter [Caballeronia sp. GAWG1-1]|uniref:MFS transporter n=1 Tax=Caballeronia sp. GAWG1-1 TaxID=2921742 RepID=UPI0020276DBB|nr:MFS transporter [Caballeronia sp. GAWG1-1]